MIVKKRRLKKSVKIAGVSIIIGIIFVFMLVTYINRTNSLSYRLGKVGYNKEEILVIESYFNETKIKKVLEEEYNPYLDDLIVENYFIYTYLDDYTAYYKANNELGAKKVISHVNTNRNYKDYEKVIQTDISLDTKLIVNKYYQLSEDYEPEDLVKAPSTIAYSGVKVREEVKEAFEDLSAEAKKAGHKIVINSGYRSYENQEAVYKKYKANKGKEYAESYVAHAGHSEHQTGLAIDVTDYNYKNTDFVETESYQWMLKNAHRFGFILRYPEDKEDITGYNFESWHFRYVGIDIATKIYNLGITYDEYYAYYIENK